MYIREVELVSSNLIEPFRMTSKSLMTLQSNQTSELGGQRLVGIAAS